MVRRCLTALITVSLLTTGCNWLVPILFMGEHKRSVPPEFDKLVGKRVLVFVWAEQETLFDYPHIRYELAGHVKTRLENNIEDCQVVDPAGVEDFLQRTFDAVNDPKHTGEHFQADVVLYVELLQFQVRDPNSPDLLQGKLSTAITVFDLSVDPDQLSEYTLAPVDVVYPEQPTIMSRRNAMLIRRETYSKFAEELVRKFHEHQIDL